MPWKKSEPMDQRREFALKALGALNFRTICQEYGIAPRQDTRRERFLRQGLEGMDEESRRPRSSPKQLSESQVCEMVKLKLARASALGTAQDPHICTIGATVRPSESSFKRVLEQVSLT